MAKTYFNEQQIKKWFVDEQAAKKVYHDDKLVFSGGFELVIASSNHNVTAGWVWSLLPADQQAAQGNTIIIKVNPGVQLVTADTGVNGVFNFYGGWSGKIVVIENNGIILGRGGNGGGWPDGTTKYPGAAGGRAIYHANVLASLSIDNKGTIGGGGGGGASYTKGGAPTVYLGGGGGAPFGAGGGVLISVNNKPGGAASFTTGGAGGVYQSYTGGTGGSWGQPGGGAAGEATRGTINWINRGDIRGATV